MTIITINNSIYTPHVPSQITGLQMLLVLQANGYITAAEATNRATLPSAFTPALAGMSQSEKDSLQIRWANFTIVPRTDPFVLSFGPILGLNETQIDDMFRQAAAL